MTEQARLEELFELLRIPSVSADAERAGDLERAARWLADLTGGELTSSGGNPLVDARLPASSGGGRTVLVYGHYDVQPPGPLELWETPPFEPQVRDGWLHARGVADDKGNLHAIVRAALDLAEEAALPVDVRLVCDGEEEIGGHSVIDHIAGIEGPIAAAIVFDSLMAAPRLPSLTTALRGIVGFQVRLRANEREVHSGMFGGAAANALHDLMRTLSAVVELPDELTAGVEAPDREELEGWQRLPEGARELSSVGAAPADERAAAELYERTWARPSITVHSLAAGDPTLQKTSIPPEATASLSLRLAPGQDPERISAQLERLLRDACPAHAQLELAPWPSAAPARIPLDLPELRAAQAALERATGVTPVTLRSGGSIPLVASLVERGIAVVLSGFASALDNIHSPNERMEVERLDWAYRSARELLLGLR